MKITNKNHTVVQNLHDILDKELRKGGISEQLRTQLISNLKTGYVEPHSILLHIERSSSPQKDVQPVTHGGNTPKATTADNQTNQNIPLPRILSIKAKHFRGLPNTNIKIKGKNLLVFGPNGTGKSNIADAFEFFFSGQVARVNGEVLPLTSLGKPGDPTVELVHEKGTTSCSLTKGQTITNSPNFSKYFASHPVPDAFILRRERLLRFIHASPAERYKRFSPILGMEDLNTQSVAFEKAKADSANDQRLVEERRRGLFLALRSIENNALDIQQLLNAVSILIKPLGLAPLETLQDVEQRLKDIAPMLTSRGEQQIAKLNIAISRLAAPIAPELQTSIMIFKQTNEILNQAICNHEDAGTGDVITAGIHYLENTPWSDTCPLCKQPINIASTLQDLKNRNHALRLLREAQLEHQHASKSIQNLIQNASITIGTWLTDIPFAFSEQQLAVLNEYKESLEQYIHSIFPIEHSHDSPDLLLSVPTEVIKNSALIAQTATLQITSEIQSRTQNDNSIHLTAHQALSKLSEQGPAIVQVEMDLIEHKQKVDIAETLRVAFSKALIEAIKSAIGVIENTARKFYSTLHSDTAGNEFPECTGLYLNVNRHGKGSIPLTVDFLSLANKCDPVHYLSEGHLDSLGLCLFLAAVKHFNAPGTLLVLDDVLTSIDIGHRSRVVDLLFSEFQDYQIIMTTHDDQLSEFIIGRNHIYGNTWKQCTFTDWHESTGPIAKDIHSYWDFINTNCTRNNYQSLGGPLRKVFEKFLKSYAELHKMRIPYKSNGKYTAYDFIMFANVDKLNIAEHIQKKILESIRHNNTDRDDTSLIDTSRELIRTHLSHTMAVGNLINELSHESSVSISRPFEEVRNFVNSLKFFEHCCREHKLINY